MADRDWSVWLEDRLSDPWTADRVATALNSDVLQQVGAKWASMTSPVKMRVMLAMIGARKGDPKIADEFKKLLLLAANDEDEWVVVIGSMLRDLMVSERIVAPTNEGEPGAAIYTSSLEAIRSILSQTWVMDLEPLESLYLGGCVRSIDKIGLLVRHDSCSEYRLTRGHCEGAAPFSAKEALKSNGIWYQDSIVPSIGLCRM
jgi:hypothetical protein